MLKCSTERMRFAEFYVWVWKFRVSSGKFGVGGARLGSIGLIDGWIVSCFSISTIDGREDSSDRRDI